MSALHQALLRDSPLTVHEVAGRLGDARAADGRVDRAADGGVDRAAEFGSGVGHAAQVQAAVRAGTAAGVDATTDHRAAGQTTGLRPPSTLIAVPAM